MEMTRASYSRKVDYQLRTHFVVVKLITILLGEVVVPTDFLLSDQLLKSRTVLLRTEKSPQNVLRSSRILYQEQNLPSKNTHTWCYHKPNIYRYHTMQCLKSHRKRLLNTLKWLKCHAKVFSQKPFLYTSNLYALCTSTDLTWMVLGSTYAEVSYCYLVTKLYIFEYQYCFSVFIFCASATSLCEATAIPFSIDRHDKVWHLHNYADCCGFESHPICL